MNGRKREEEKHEGKKAGREGGEKIKMKGRREECHLVISGVRKLEREEGPRRVKWKEIDSSGWHSTPEAFEALA